MKPALPIKVILRLNEGSSGILATRAAMALLASDHKDCIYSFGDTHIWARRNKSSVTAYEEPETNQ